MKRLNLLLLIVIFMGFTGCDFLSRTWPSITDRYPFRNYYVDGDGVLAVSRVLVMPFSNSTDWADASREVTAVFILELNKLNRFEVVIPGDSANTTLRERLAKGGVIDYGNARSICDTYGADAIIFGEIKHYEPYKPFVLGIKFSMISAEKNRPIWIVDEILDSSMKKVSNAAKHYYYKQIDSGVYRSGSEVMENSMKMYTQFVCSSMIATLNSPESGEK